MVFDEADVISSDGIYDYISPKDFLAAQKSADYTEKSPGKTATTATSTPPLKPGERPAKPARRPVETTRNRYLPPLPSEDSASTVPSKKKTKEDKTGTYVTVTPPEQKKTPALKEHPKEQTQSNKKAKSHGVVAKGSGISARNMPLPVPTEHSICTVKDIPEDISDLGIQEIGQCLKLLKLDDLVEGFKENQINGALLKELEPADIVDAFGCNKLIAKKLYLFAKGEWRPDK